MEVKVCLYGGGDGVGGGNDIGDGGGDGSSF